MRLLKLHALIRAGYVILVFLVAVVKLIGIFSYLGLAIIIIGGFVRKVLLAS